MDRKAIKVSLFLCVVVVGACGSVDRSDATFVTRHNVAVKTTEDLGNRISIKRIEMETKLTAIKWANYLNIQVEMIYRHIYYAEIYVVFVDEKDVPCNDVRRYGGCAYSATNSIEIAAGWIEKTWECLPDGWTPEDIRKYEENHLFGLVRHEISHIIAWENGIDSDEHHAIIAELEIY